MEKVLADINPSWPKDYIIRALYVRLAPFFQRDLKYFLASNERKMELYKKGFPGISEYGICLKVCDFFLKIFPKYGITAHKFEINEEGEVPHSILIVEGDNNKTYLMDPWYDLLASQAHLEPKFFGATNDKFPFFYTFSKNHRSILHCQGTNIYEEYQMCD